MDLSLLLKASVGFLLVLVIQIAARSKSYYLAALIPLFPSMAIFSYYFVGQSQSVARLQETIAFGLFSLLPYFFFLLSLFFAVRLWRVSVALWAASGAWLIVAFLLVQVWPWLKLGLGFKGD